MRAPTPGAATTSAAPAVARAGCDKYKANRRAWRRRLDGVLISGTHEIAIEVETTAKPLDQYLAILDAYADQGVESHWYAVPTAAQERILQAAEVLDVQDLVRVWDWPAAAVRGN